MSVTPVVGPNTVVTTGGTAVVALPSNPNGGYVVNPLADADQGIPAEVLYVDPVGVARTTANGTTFALQPGQRWDAIPGQSTPTTVNAVTSGHKFTAVFY